MNTISSPRRTPFTVVAHDALSLLRALNYYGDSAEANIQLSPSRDSVIFRIPEREYQCSFVTDRNRVNVIAPEGVTIISRYKEKLTA